MTYTDPKYGQDSTTALSRLRFDYISKSSGKKVIRAMFFSVDLNGNEVASDGIPAKFVSTGTNEIADSAFFAAIASAQNTECTCTKALDAVN